MSTFNVHEWNRKRYLSEEEVNEISMFENHIWDNVKRMRHNLEDLRRFGSPQEAIKVLDRIIDYLKDVKADIEYKSSQE